MLRMLPVALLLAAAPALAAKPSDVIKVDENGQAYKIKKVCHTVEVAGSFIPRTSCVNKKIPVKAPDPQTQEAANSVGGTGEAPKAPEEE